MDIKVKTVTVIIRGEKGETKKAIYAADGSSKSPDAELVMSLLGQLDCPPGEDDEAESAVASAPAPLSPPPGVAPVNITTSE